VRAGYLESSRRGVWSLTEKGAQTDLATFDAYEVFQLVQKSLRAEKKKKEEVEEPFIDERAESSVEAADYKSELLAMIKLLPPEGFERLCQRLFANRVFKRLWSLEEAAMAESTELGSCKLIHSSVLTFYFNANVIKVPSLLPKFATFEEPWLAVRTKAL